MKKTFHSKIDLLLLIPTLTLLLTAEIFMIVNAIIIGIIAFASIAAFVMYLCRKTIYVFTPDNKLMVKTGFVYVREIYIKSIKKITPTNSRSASPALSLDRLEIRYNRYGRLIVSPKDKAIFIKQLKDVNPRIRVEETDNNCLYKSVEERVERLFYLGNRVRFMRQRNKLEIEKLK